MFARDMSTMWMCFLWMTRLLMKALLKSHAPKSPASPSANCTSMAQLPGGTQGRLLRSQQQTPHRTPRDGVPRNLVFKHEPFKPNLCERSEVFLTLTSLTYHTFTFSPCFWPVPAASSTLRSYTRVSWSCFKDPFVAQFVSPPCFSAPLDRKQTLESLEYVRVYFRVYVMSEDQDTCPNKNPVVI